jgi:hypothetical protein
MLGSSNAIARSNSPHFPDRTELWINNHPHKRVRATVVFDNPGISLKARQSHLQPSMRRAFSFHIAKGRPGRPALARRGDEPAPKWKAPPRGIKSLATSNGCGHKCEYVVNL